MRLIKEDGHVFLTAIEVQGRKVLRFAVVSALVTQESIDRAITIIKKCLTQALEIFTIT